MGLYLDYRCANTTASDKEMKPHFRIGNGGSSSVALSSLSIRYYFTSDGSTSLGFNCDYATLGCANLSGSFGTATGTNADHYLEVTFGAGAGTLSPGANSGEIQTRFHDSGFQVTFTQGNDYSFDATKTAFGTWDKITLYQDGALVWGVEP
ncbi:hydrolase (secreted protein) [Minicystis rosea]|nr:hydrolase (secreted protein) [Minicystis rosea]